MLVVLGISSFRDCRHLGAKASLPTSKFNVKIKMVNIPSIFSWDQIFHELKRDSETEKIVILGWKFKSKSKTCVITKLVSAEGRWQLNP